MGRGLDRTEVGQMRALVSTSAARTGRGAWLRQLGPNWGGLGLGGGGWEWEWEWEVKWPGCRTVQAPPAPFPELVEGACWRALALTGLTRTDFQVQRCRAA